MIKTEVMYKKFDDWAKKHHTEILTGGAILVVLVGIWGFKYQKWHK
jgi:hypothetical protein